MLLLLGFGSFDAAAQNTKGDRPEVKYGGKRESRFKFPRKKNKSTPSYNRVKSRRFSPANSGRVSRANKNVYANRNYSGNRSISGRSSRQNSRSGGGRVTRTTSSNRNIYSGRNSSGGRSISGKLSRQNNRPRGGRVSVRTSSSRTRNVYPQRGRYVNNRSTIRSGSREKAVSNRRQLARVKRFSARPSTSGVRGRVTPASASKPFISRKSINPFAGFWNQKPKGEKAYTRGDIAGRKLRMKNYETKKPVLVNPTAHPYKVKFRKSERAYKGTMPSGYVSRSQSGKAWRGDISGRRIRGRNYSSKKATVAGQRINPPPRSIRTSGRTYRGRLLGGGNKSISGKIQKGQGTFGGARSLGRTSFNNKGRPLPGRNAGANGTISRFSGNIKGRRGYSDQGGTYAGNIKGRKREKGGGSIKASWNNKGRALPGRNAGANGNIRGFSGNIKGRRTYSDQGGTYSGSIKAHKREKGGGSISGSWNNKGRSIPGRYGGGDPKVSAFQGSLKFQRQQKGGGSISGRLWNNKGRAVVGRYPGGDQRVSSYQGNVKFQRSQKGGGTISGSWNNKGRAIAGRYPGCDPKISNHRGYKQFQLKPSMRNQGEEFTGSIKARPKPKGGGSISGKLWNNKEQSTTVRNPNSGKMALYQGNVKLKKDTKKDVDYFPGKHRMFDLHPSMRDQGEEYTGDIKLSRFKKNYVKNPNASDNQLKKARPDKNTYLVNGLQIKVKQKEYRKRPNAAQGSMPGIAPGKNSVRASEYTRVIRQRWDYKRNPSSAHGALKVREPGKAFARATDYQGNIKMKKFDLFGKKDRFPDSQFIKINKNNTVEERSMLTNFKLWWARLFKKNDNQPDHLKEKERKPRYDKGEKGLWYD